MADAKVGPAQARLVADLYHIFQDLAAHDFPVVPNPPEVTRRASVALIVRINPSYDHWPSGNTTTTTSPTDQQSSDTLVPSQLAAFFAQDWVQHGTPEVLFIKRASRPGDRWTGHVALPGGRRDPDDADDRAAAVREAREEVGLDLSRDALAAGSLPQRVVTTSWGKTPIMVLCPYVFVLTAPHAPLALQPSEVAAAHWVPLRALMARSLRTLERQDVSGRLARADLSLERWFYRGMLGCMRFSAIRLTPSASAYAHAVPPFAADIAAPPPQLPLPLRVARALGCAAVSDDPVVPPAPPLNVWGLTLGVVADFLDLVPPHAAGGLWAYPTFDAPDVRFAIWALSAGFRARRARAMRGDDSGDDDDDDDDALERGGDDSDEAAAMLRRRDTAGGSRGNDALEIGAEAAISAKAPLHRRPAKAGIEGLNSGLVRRHEFDADTFSTTLELYYDYVRAGIACALGVRVAVVAGALGWGIWRVRRR